MPAPRRYQADFTQVKAADKARFLRFTKQLGNRKSAFFDLENPKPGEILFLLSLIPSYQRPFDAALKDMIKFEIDRVGWSAHNGRAILLYLDDDGELHTDDGYHRLAALWEHHASGRPLPDLIRVCVTRDAKAYETVDAGGKPRKARDMAIREGREPLSGGVAAGIIYERFDFKVPPVRLSPAAVNALHYAEPTIVEFARSLPQSGGDSKGWYPLAGVYAGAIRAFRKYPEDEVRAFFSALIRAEQFIGEHKVVPLIEAGIAFKKYEADKKGMAAKVMAATISMNAFVAWADRKRLTKAMLAPPKGMNAWPTAMSRPLPIELDDKAQAAE
jgi:hypothetical protein